MGKTEPIKSKPRKTVNLPPRKSVNLPARKSVNLPPRKSVNLLPKKSVAKKTPIEDDENQLADQSMSGSSESSGDETEESRNHEGVSERSKQIKKPAKRTGKRPSLLGRMRNYYDVSLNSTAALSNLGQKDIAFLFEKSDRTLENDLDFCEYKLNQFNEAGETNGDLARASDGSQSSSSDGSSDDSSNDTSNESSDGSSDSSNFESECIASPQATPSEEATRLVDSKSRLLVSYGLSSDEDADA